MKAPSETPEPSDKKSPGNLLTIPIFVIAALLIYFCGGIAGRVLYIKGVLRDGSRTLRFVETVYKPVSFLYSQSPTFKTGFDTCVFAFTPK